MNTSNFRIANFSNKPGKHFVIVSAACVTSLDQYEVQVQLDRQIENVTAMKVKHFAMVDDGVDLPLVPNGSLLLLLSNLGSAVVNTSFRNGTSVDQDSVSEIQYSDIIAWSVSARAASTGFNPLSLPSSGGSKLLFSSPKNIYNFNLRFATPAQNMPTHTNPYCLQAVLKFYTC